MTTRLRPTTVNLPFGGLNALWKRYLSQWRDSIKLSKLNYRGVTKNLTPTLVEALIWKAMGGRQRLKMWIKPLYPLTNQKNLYNLWRKESESAS